MKFGNWQYSKNSIRERIHINKDIDFVWPFLGLSDKIFFQSSFSWTAFLELCFITILLYERKFRKYSFSNDGLILG